MSNEFDSSVAYFFGRSPDNKHEAEKQLMTTLKTNPFNFVSNHSVGSVITSQKVQDILEDVAKLPHNSRVLIYITGELEADNDNVPYINLAKSHCSNPNICRVTPHNILNVTKHSKAKYIVFLFDIPIPLKYLEPLVKVGGPSAEQVGAYQVIIRDKNTSKSFATVFNGALKHMNEEHQKTLTDVTYSMSSIFPTFNLYVVGSKMGDFPFIL